MLEKLRELMNNGDCTVYVFCDVLGAFSVCQCTVDSVLFWPRTQQYTVHVHTQGEWKYLTFTEADYGKTLFDSRDEAEARMREHLNAYQHACD